MELINNDWTLLRFVFNVNGLSGYPLVVVLYGINVCNDYMNFMY